MSVDPSPVIAALLSRRSLGPRALCEPGPSAEQWQLAADAALRAPDHQGLRPFRFVHVGREERAALARVFAAGARAQGRDDEGIRLASARADTGPGLLAVVARIRDDVPDVPPHEQWICVGAAVMNLLNALHAMGFGAKTLGGSAARQPAVVQAFCDAGEQLACWVIAGRPLATDPPAERHARDLLTDWVPPSP